jgi:hypothetical protein
MHERAKRTAVTGWTASSVRRHTKFLYSVETDALDGFGYAPTLTIRHCPADARAFHQLRTNWIRRMERLGSTRIHWVIEWQRRGVPHLHAAVYFDRELSLVEQSALLTNWTDLATDYGASFAGQHVAPIDGAAGWLQYLSKHAARGAAHYQRQGKPDGWETTGRLWGHTGPWPVQDSLTFHVPAEGFFQFRRLVRQWRLADARSETNVDVRRRRIRSARRMLACNERKLSEVRGISEWISQDQLVQFLGVLAAQGFPVRQV